MNNTPCTMCTCPNCMARYEAEAIRYYWEHSGQFQQENLQREYDRYRALKAIEPQSRKLSYDDLGKMGREESVNYGGRTYFLFGAAILALMYYAFYG